MNNQKGQVTIFIIIAIIIVVAVVGFFALRDSVSVKGIPANIEPVYTSFLLCLEEDISTGISVLESSGGYIELPDFEPGSGYMPFSSQLNFLGNPVPYWYYVSGNNIEKEQVPSKKNMEEQLGRFVEEEISGCRFDSYYEQGFEINFGEPKVKISIKDNEVKADLDMDFNVNFGEDSVLIQSHEFSVKSKLGELYDSAKNIYEKEQEDLFLENYAVDILRLYAPVDGVEISCSPQIWKADEVFDNLEEAIEANTLALKTSGKKDDYFVVDLKSEISSGIEVKFLNSRNWPNGFEVAPSEGSLMIATPVGNQPGLGMLGFCYVPYHFVYNIKYPVLVQLFADEEIFQFPMAVVLSGNKPREALDSDAVEFESSELCKYKNTLVEVNTYDTRLNPVSADISYECFGTKCDIGKTSLTQSLEGEFPQCVNGYVLAKADGFLDSKYLYSTTATEKESVDIILDRLYETEIDLKLDGRDYSKDAIISFISDKSSNTIIYPEQKIIELSEGQYKVSVYVYRNSSLKLESATKKQCVEIPDSGIGGIFGLTKEKCFDIEIPEQIVSSALSGGGKENYYILESDLESSNTLRINAKSLPLPKSIKQLQDNYILFEENDLEINFT